MLEAFLSFEEINKRPYLMFFWTFVLSSVGIILSMRLSFNIIVSGININLNGIFAVLFIIIPAAYLITNIIKREEEMEEAEIEKKYKKGVWRIWVRHEKDMLLLLFFFFGLVISFAVWSLILPTDFFQIQDLEITKVRSNVLGDATSSTLSLEKIFYNNLTVMFFSFIFSILFGAGAVFILVWNAGILGVFIGQLSKSVVDIVPQTLRFLPHAIPEIGGFILAALAGGILSAMVLRGHHKKGAVKTVLFDAGLLMILAVIFIFGAALIEVYL